MIHLENALNEFRDEKIGDKNFTDFISIENNEIKIKIQDGVISQNGVNGIQINDVVRYAIEVFKSLNNTFSCRENAITITKLQEAVMWQEERTKNRIKRNVEGKNIL